MVKEVVELYSNRLTLYQFDLPDPRELPLSAVRCLLDMPNPADYSLYLEDDLVVSDSKYIDKYATVCERTNHDYILMPHRRELPVVNLPRHLYVDGPIKLEGQHENLWATSKKQIAMGRFGTDKMWNFVGHLILILEAFA